jgi:serine/threonine protein phosphatase 1
MQLSKLWKPTRTPSQRQRGLPPGHRIYAIGDVHGCRTHLAALLEKIRSDVSTRQASHVTLVYLGDYIDRGPDSAGVLALAMSNVSWADQTVRIKGNHEEMLERFLAEPSYGMAWRQFGGVPTLASYGIETRSFQLGRELEQVSRDLSRAMPTEHHNFIRSLVYSHTEGGYFFCHAGVRPGVALEQQQPADLCWIRHEFLSSLEEFGLMIVHGHSPVEAPEVHPNRVNVDTGAYATGCLSCAVLEGERIDFISVGMTDVVC